MTPDPITAALQQLADQHEQLTQLTDLITGIGDTLREHESASRSRCICHSRRHVLPRTCPAGWYRTSAKLSSVPGSTVSPASDPGCGRAGTSHGSCGNSRRWMKIQLAWSTVTRSGMRRRPAGIGETISRITDPASSRLTLPLKWS